MSRLVLKANVQASTVCKTWFQAAVSVRKLQSRPWLFYRLTGANGNCYMLYDTLRCQTHKLDFQELKKSATFSYSRDGWLLVRMTDSRSIFLLNPFTRERICLPEGSGYLSAFSAAPTSDSCLVISFVLIKSCLVIKTWRPGATVWTKRFFMNHLPEHKWAMCVFLNGMFYFLRTHGYLGVFDLSRETWYILPVEPCPAVRYAYFTSPVSMIEHEGDIFVTYIGDNKKPSAFELNLKEMLWVKKRGLGGLTVFVSHPGSFARAGLSAEERNRIYPSDVQRNDMYYYSFDDEKSSHTPLTTYLSPRIAWVDPPLNNFNL